MALEGQFEDSYHSRVQSFKITTLQCLTIKTNTTLPLCRPCVFATNPQINIIEGCWRMLTKRLHLSTSHLLHGCCKLRYLAAPTIFKTKLKIRKTIKNLIWKTSPLVIQHCFSQLTALNTLTIEFIGWGHKQPRKFGTNIFTPEPCKVIVELTDTCFDFFLKVDQLTLTEERKWAYQKKD